MQNSYRRFAKGALKLYDNISDVFIRYPYYYRNYIRPTLLYLAIRILVLQLTFVWLWILQLRIINMDMTDIRFMVEYWEVYGLAIVASGIGILFINMIENKLK